ncbi:head-to-tail adaptor [Mycobacterium phage Yuna]|uniref:Head-to-tail adaptor n=1 Tax=Mycobacterium phage Yuna TaxID=2599885 RepID=A0A5J6TF50_9CAUD|nr:head-to-tail adaptor [Mycobacterium phage Yuna]QFG09396.1 head-to-tail adaptor [Mycobacterium phage Yuna]
MLASLADVQAALRAMGRADLADALTEAEVSPLLTEAGDLVTGYLWPTPVPDPIPGPISRVTAAMAAAVLTRPKELLPETQSLSADGFGVTFAPGTGSPGPYLTAALKARLRPFRVCAVSVPMSSERF